MYGRLAFFVVLMALSALLAEKGAWSFLTLGERTPREKARIELPAGILAPAFAPEAL